MRRVLYIFMMAVGALTSAGAAPYSEIIDLNAAYQTSTTLSSGIYRLSEDLSKSAAIGQNALSVAENATAVIYLPRGLTLEVNGGDARAPEKASKSGNDNLGANGENVGSWAGDGAGAGIYVPESATLIITGEGKLIARGGNAASGMRGFRAKTDGKEDGSDSYVGGGGMGGVGGGGAGAAIGGRGGKGGKGGESIEPTRINSQSLDNWETTTYGNNNMDGKPGAAGGSGTAMGTVYLLGTVSLTLSGGVSGTAGGNGGAYSGKAWNNKTDDWFLGPGGGGGGGGAGNGVSFAIGGGGAGGGGGGGGATGQTFCCDDIDDETSNGYIRGEGGKGGYGAVPGKQGEHDPDAYVSITKDVKGYGNDTVTGKAGGAAGNLGENGSDAMVYLQTTVDITMELPNQQVYFQESRAISGFEVIQYDLSFRITGDKIETVKQTLGCAYPERQVPIRPGYIFRGYFSGRNGTGELYYDAKGQFVRDHVFNQCAPQTLYASWEIENHTDDHFVVNAGETLEYDGLIDKNDFIQSKTGNLFTVKRGGMLILKNITVVGSDLSVDSTIYNAGSLVVSNCVFRENRSQYGWGGVYRDRPGARAVFYGCTFKENSALEGGVIAAEGSDVSVVYSSFFNNYTQLESDGIDQAEGAVAIAIADAKLDLVSCTLASNVCASASGCNLALYDLPAQENVTVMNSICTTGGNPLWGGLEQQGIENLNNLIQPSAEGLLSMELKRELGGVEHLTRRPLPHAREGGDAGRLYRNEDFTRFSVGATGETPYFLAFDQVGQHPLEGWYGAMTGNTLQYLINTHENPDEPLVVKAGRYDPVYVDKTIHIVGEDRGSVLINGDILEPCVEIRAGGEECSWSDFTFIYGKGENGGGMTAPSAGGAYVTNCVFLSCSATNGGGAANLKTASQCVFDQCVADKNGGGLYASELVDRSLFSQCIASGLGGGVSEVGTVRASLLSRNTAKQGGGGNESAFYNCTFDRNVASDSEDSYAAVAKSPLIGCLLYGNLLPTERSSDQTTYNALRVSAQYTDKMFYAAPNDFHLKIRNYDKNTNTRTPVNHEKISLNVNEPNVTKQALLENWLDFEGNPLVSRHPISGALYHYAGCYAFAPLKISGLVVTGTNEWYDDTNAQTSLREAIETAVTDPAYATNEVATITFADHLLPKEGEKVVVLTLGESQIDVTDFTNRKLVIEGPTNRVVGINGARAFRAFRVFSGNNLEVKNLLMQNCLGSEYGTAQPSAHGGAILNHGNLVVSNCVFAANTSGTNKTINGRDIPIGYGGALATIDQGDNKAKSTVFNTTFYANEAQCGGAVYTGKNTRTDVFFSTFTGNQGRGSGSDEASGGALAADLSATNALLTLVNCTVVGNSVPDKRNAGGGIVARGGLTLLDSIVLGNTSGGETNDLVVVNGSITNPSQPKLISSVIGTRTEPSMFVKYQEDATHDATALTDFVATTNALDATTVMPHLIYPASTKTAVEPLVVRWSPKNDALGYYSLAGGSSRLTAIRGNLTDLNRNGKNLSSDQLGEGFSTAIFGASAQMMDPPTEGGETPGEGDEPPPEDPLVNAKVTITDCRGVVTGYSTAAAAAAAYRPGDTLRVVDEEDDDLIADLDGAIYWKLVDFAAAHPWFDFVADADALFYSLTLNDRATPVAAAIEVDYSPTEVAMRTVENMKPGLWYALGYSDSPAGPFTAGDWQEGKGPNSFGQMYFERPLTAPKTGASGFYRVIVAPYPIR